MATIRDVAERAAVSTITVSRVINEHGYVRDETRQRVLQAIDELHYIPNLQARSLRSHRTHTLALLVTDITNPFWTTVARGVEDIAAANNISVILGNTDENLIKEQRYIQVMVEKRVDGVLIVPSSSDGSSLRPLMNHGIPVVVIDRRLDVLNTDVVLGDNQGATEQLVSALIAHGHRRIGIITGPPGIWTADERLAGYYMALEAAGISSDSALIWRGGFNQATGHAGIGAFLALAERPTAIFAGNNFIALGTLLELEERGYKVPEQMMLAAFDELPLLAAFGPTLLLAIQPAYEMGVVATELLLARIAGETSAAREIVLETRLDLKNGAFGSVRAGAVALIR